MGAEAYAALDLDFLTDHITTFTLAALGLSLPLDRAGEPEPLTHEQPGKEGGPWHGSR